MSVSIVADDRERESQVFCVLAGHAGVELSTERLVAGDYRVNERLLFERKTLPDLKQSIVDGRFFRQAIRLASSEYTPVLVLEGSHYDPPGPEVSREAVQGALINASLVLGIPVLRSLSSPETAWIMLCADNQVRRIAKGAVQRPGYRPKGRRKRQLFILQGLPGIGRDRAELLLETFGSVERVFTAGYDDLLQVKGIGRKTARQIRDMVREAGLDYGQTC
ncbi:MAG: ERCC4 domain-containing protein [Desulfonatronovibrionaceae bacterium]